MSPFLWVVIVIPWPIAVAGCWLGYQLTRQNGRILLALEALEQRISHLSPPVPVPTPTMPTGLPIGSAAPEFELPTLDGETKKISEFIGRRVLLIFFNPSCGFCQQMAPGLAELPMEGADGRPIPIVVTTGGADRNRELIRKHGITFPVLLQNEMEIAGKYQVSGTPIGYLIDEHGHIASEMAIGSDALLALSTPALQEDHKSSADTTGHNVKNGNRPLSDSRISRNGLAPGTPAPGFRLPRVEGGELSLEEYWGKTLLLVFSAPDCGPCNELAPKLERLHRENADLEIIMVSRGDREAVQAKVAEYGLSFPVVLQRQWEISRLYAMFATPIAYLIDEKGFITSEVAVGEAPILDLLSRRDQKARAAVI